MKSTIKGVTMTGAAGIIFGAFPIFTRLFTIFGGSVDAFNLYGFLLSVVILGVFILITGRSFLLPGKTGWFVLLAGLMNVVTRILLTYSYHYLSAGTATTLHFLYPLFAALLGALFFREKMPIYKWIAFVVASASVALFGFGGMGSLTGILLAVSSAVCFALYMLITERANLTALDPVVFVFYVCVVSSVGSLAMSLVSGTLSAAMPMKALIVLILCAVLNNAVAFALQQQGVKHLGAAMAALFSLFEPVFSCIFGVIFLRELLSLNAILGIVIILSCLTAIVLLDHRKTQ